MNNDTSQQPQPGAGGPRVDRHDLKDMTRLRRSVADRKIAGVASGLARYLDIDPTVVRVILGISVFFGGAGLIAYLALWLLVPEDGSADRPLGLDDRTRGLAVAGIGVLTALALLGGSWGLVE